MTPFPDDALVDRATECAPRRVVRGLMVPPRNPQGSREGFTTGTAAAAASKAACLVLLERPWPESVPVRLPSGRSLEILINRLESKGTTATAGVVKDAGDDPDVTHGAEILAAVSWMAEPGIAIDGGLGVGRITRPGLELPVGWAAINPVPRTMIQQAVADVLGGVAPRPGISVVISVPEGEDLARRTLNGRLGIVGGISILGTSGIVRAMSTAAWRAAVVQSIDVAAANRLTHLVLTTGGRSETFAQKLLGLPELAYIQMGIFTGDSLRRCAERGIGRATLCGMIGKLAKIAMGQMQTHVAGGGVDARFLAEVAASCGADAALTERIAVANSARHVEELIDAAGLAIFYHILCERAREMCRNHVEKALEVEVVLFDFAGRVLGRSGGEKRREEALFAE